MKQRYNRAIRLTAPKFSATVAGAPATGYWLDDECFYFPVERFEPSLGRSVATPSIAHVGRQRVETVVTLEDLAGILSTHLGQKIDLSALCSAEFDMPDAHTLAVSIAGGNFLVDVRTRSVRASAPSLDLPALYSPDGRFACLVKGHDLWLMDRRTGTERPLTTNGAPHHSYGQESESNLSALSYRRRPYPLGLWSPDSQWLLTHRIDERDLPELVSMQHAPPSGGRPVLHRYKYPFPGDPIPMATYVAIHVVSGRVVTFDDFPAPVLAYSPFSVYRMAWFGGEGVAWFLRTDRYNKHADLIRLDFMRGTAKAVLTETVSTGYIEFHQSMVGKPNVWTLEGSNEIVWFSERDGWGHLYLYDAATGALKNGITRGEWMVRDIIHVDPRHRKLLFTACGMNPDADPARRSLCSVNLDGSGFEVLLSHDGDLAVPRTDPGGLLQDRPYRPCYALSGISPNGRFGVIRLGSVERGDVTQVVDLATRHGFVISSVLAPAGQGRAQPFTALAADGMTRIHGTLFFPSDFDAGQRYPLIDYIYPGPHVTHQPQSFSSIKAGFARAMAELGCVVLTLDTRAMPFRSRALHQIGYGEFLEPQLADHAAVVRQLCERHPFIDGDRVGILGYSAGGAATARALFDYGSIFKVGVSVCGNHDNTANVAMFSDKYRGPGPRESWPAQANSTVAHKLTGKLLLVSGDMDDNAHISHTLALVDALIRANREFDLLIVPNEGHDLLIANGYVLRRVWDYFVQHLFGKIPPTDFKIEFTPYEIDRQERNWVGELAC